MSCGAPSGFRCHPADAGSRARTAAGPAAIPGEGQEGRGVHVLPGRTQRGDSRRTPGHHTRNELATFPGQGLLPISNSIRTTLRCNVCAATRRSHPRILRSWNKCSSTAAPEKPPTSPKPRRSSETGYTVIALHDSALRPMSDYCGAGLAGTGSGVDEHHRQGDVVDFEAKRRLGTDRATSERDSRSRGSWCRSSDQQVT